MVFHIGKTYVMYDVNSDYGIFSLGYQDGFWDALYMFEKSDKNPNGIEPDGRGWKLELGIPYAYIPMAVLIPNNVQL